MFLSQPTRNDFYKTLGTILIYNTLGPLGAKLEYTPTRDLTMDDKLIYEHP